jgi:LytR_cpsA_psr family
MPDDPRNSAPPEDRPYRLYRSDGESQPGSSPRAAVSGEDRPYTVYRAKPRGLRARLRGEEDADVGGSGGGGDGGGGGRRWFRGSGATGGWATARRVLKYVVLAIVAWLLLSLVLFLVSAQHEQSNLPTNVSAALKPAGNMITSTDTVLIIGTDQRPKGTHEAGANTNDTGSRSDTIMLWRIGGGTSRRLSIPRDTEAAIPGHGVSKINAAYAYGGPALAIKTIEQSTSPPSPSSSTRSAGST